MMEQLRPSPTHHTDIPMGTMDTHTLGRWMQAPRLISWQHLHQRRASPVQSPCNPSPFSSKRNHGTFNGSEAHQMSLEGHQRRAPKTRRRLRKPADRYLLPRPSRLPGRAQQARTQRSERRLPDMMKVKMVKPTQSDPSKSLRSRLWTVHIKETVVWL